MKLTQVEKAKRLNSLHVPGEPLIVVNVWDAITAKIVSEVPGVAALATASHSVSNVRGLEDGERLRIELARGLDHVIEVRDFDTGAPLEGVTLRSATGNTATTNSQ